MLATRCVPSVPAGTPSLEQLASEKPPWLLLMPGESLLRPLQTHRQGTKYFEAPNIKVLKNVEVGRMASYFVWKGTMEAEEFITPKEGRSQERVGSVRRSQLLGQCTGECPAPSPGCHFWSVDATLDAGLSAANPVCHGRGEELLSSTCSTPAGHQNPARCLQIDNLWTLLQGGSVMA